MESVQKIHLLEMKQKKFKGEEINYYKDFDKEFANQKFDLITIDGPIGGGNVYSRTDVLDLVPNSLKESFIIMIDDVERIGEKNTIKLLEEKLTKNKIEFSSSFNYTGETCVYICTSKNYDFLCHL